MIHNEVTGEGMQITQTLHRHLQIAPDQPMTICGDQVRTVAQVHDRVARLAAGLQSLGVATDDRVGIMALNTDRYHEVLLAVPWAGAAINPINTRWSPAEVAYSLIDCGTELLFVDDTFAPLVPDLMERAPVLTTVIHLGDGPAPAGFTAYEELIATHEPAPDAERRGADLFGVFYTGGTTGHPKGVMLSHNNLMTSAMGSLVTTDVFSRGGRILHTAPMFHLADLAAWTIGLMTGSAHVMVPTFTPAGVVDIIARHRVTDGVLVPTMIQMLLDSPEAETADLSSMQGVLYGASAISETLLARARAKMPQVRFTQGYGMTELSPIATMLTATDHDNPALSRAAGRPAVHSQVRIVDVDDNDLPRGEVGEIIVRGDHVMLGYWNKPDETAQALRGGWMHTGDAGRMDDDGYVYVVDRIKDMVITGGENVYSVEVENALAKHPAVAQVAVIGVPDDRWGERVHAVVVTHPGNAVAEEELREFAREHIAGYKLPRSIAFVEAMPISGAGKILKRELRETNWNANTGR